MCDRHTITTKKMLIFAGMTRPNFGLETGVSPQHQTTCSKYCNVKSCNVFFFNESLVWDYLHG
jgi:hypothetical protein